MYLDVNWAILVDQCVIKHFDFTLRQHNRLRSALDIRNNNFINNIGTCSSFMKILHWNCHNHNDADSERSKLEWENKSGKSHIRHMLVSRILFILFRLQSSHFRKNIRSKLIIFLVRKFIAPIAKNVISTAIILQFAPATWNIIYIYRVQTDENEQKNKKNRSINRWSWWN